MYFQALVWSSFSRFFDITSPNGAYTRGYTQLKQESMNIKITLKSKLVYNVTLTRNAEQDRKTIVHEERYWGKRYVRRNTSMTVFFVLCISTYGLIFEKVLYSALYSALKWSKILHCINPTCLISGSLLNCFAQKLLDAWLSTIEGFSLSEAQAGNSSESSSVQADPTAGNLEKLNETGICRKSLAQRYFYFTLQ